ncbi:MAG: oligopeptide transporter, OPT family [Alphaproteobacteria bacterium]|nr:oligopeptide transporter, OPT family [Alphaproteobacteria bacterium]
MSEFKPYVSANESPKELTVLSVVVGIFLAILFGGATAYLGLRIGLTISASIPAAVIAMCVIRVIMKSNSILESNMVQTIGSAGESVASGIIFTIPALFLWAQEGKIDTPSILTVTALALLGGSLGVLFMIPLRKALIVKEHNVLPYPEGCACAKVLLAGEEGQNSAKSIFYGMGFSALLKLIVDAFKIIPSTIVYPIKALKTQLSLSNSPSLIAVGYICGAKISSYLFVGGFLAWFVLIPAIVIFGKDTVLFPANITILELYTKNGANAIWSSYIRYIAAGTLLTGGVISLLKSIPLIYTTFKQAIISMKNSKNNTNERTNEDLSFKTIIIAIIGIILAIWLTPVVPLNAFGSILVVIFGFFFATVASRIVGLIGSSNNPTSGMTIATLLISTTLLKLTGVVGTAGMISALSIGAIICNIVSISDDTSQDLKTGFLLGATPRKQQIGEIIGVTFSSLTIGYVIILLNKAWGFGNENLAAPQATLMKMIIEGVMDGKMPWELIGIGIALGLCVEFLRVPVLPFAIGCYLPFDTSITIMIGGLIRSYIDKKNNSTDSSNGILFSSGLIAGEGLIGILLALLTVLHKDTLFDFSKYNLGNIGGLALLLIMIYTVYKAAKEK